MELPKDSNLHLVKIATTLDLKTHPKELHSPTVNWMVPIIPGKFLRKDRPPSQQQQLISKPNNPDLQFKPARANEQCKACKQWGHTSNNCFLMSQVYWVNQFTQKYGPFCKSIADQYATYHLCNQRMAQVQLLHGIDIISQHYLEQDIFDSFYNPDKNFSTNVKEPETI